MTNQNENINNGKMSEDERWVLEQEEKKRKNNTNNFLNALMDDNNAQNNTDIDVNGMSIANNNYTLKDMVTDELTDRVIDKANDKIEDRAEKKAVKESAEKTSAKMASSIASETNEGMKIASEIGKGMKIAKGVLGIARVGLKAVPIVGQIVTAGEALYGGITSAIDTDAIAKQTGKDPSEVSLWDRIKHGAAGAFAGVANGFIDVYNLVTPESINVRNLEASDVVDFAEKSANFVIGDGFETNKELREQEQNSIETHNNSDKDNYEEEDQQEQEISQNEEKDFFAQYNNNISNITDRKFDDYSKMLDKSSQIRNQETNKKQEELELDNLSLDDIQNSVIKSENETKNYKKRI
ncbi:hypothetical protein AJY73_09900 [Campylobacter jejuni]|uniref:hypothetical protein n=1 Tax=Campylobacter jejuni TaxID=197 RepID=UPI000874495D|nr:hypothetical protein [Campylobacter jejuni]OEV62237.1 hypothetical protein AJY73_09900 [Campylobacter jejuni]HEG2942010.1 hypothetical protein [Campylobacter jejuni]